MTFLQLVMHTAQPGLVPYRSLFSEAQIASGIWSTTVFEGRRSSATRLSAPVDNRVGSGLAGGNLACTSFRRQASVAQQGKAWRQEQRGRPARMKQRSLVNFEPSLSLC
jgi:hypothetical protein